MIDIDVGGLDIDMLEDDKDGCEDVLDIDVRGLDVELSATISTPLSISIAASPSVLFFLDKLFLREDMVLQYDHIH